MCLRIGLLPALALCVALPTACRRPAGPAPIASEPLKPPEPPLPAEALLTLEQLTPDVPKPVNPPGADKLPERVAKTVADAEAMIARGGFASAIEPLERAAGFAPDNPRIRRAQAMANAGLPNRGKALKHIRVAVAGAPDDLEAQLLLGRLLQADKKPDQAAEALRTALKCSQAAEDNPAVGEVLWRLARLLALKGYHTAALGCYERLARNIAAHPRRHASRSALRAVVLAREVLLRRRGDLLLRLRRPSEAVTVLRRAHQRNRTDAATAQLLLKALVASRDFDQAERTFRDVADEPALKALAPKLAGLLCEEADDKTLPLRIWQSRKGGAEVRGELAVALARAAQKLGAEDDAATILRSVLRSMPGNLSVTRFLAQVHATQGHADQALVLLADLLRANPSALDGVRAALSRLAGAVREKDFERRFAAKTEADQGALRHVLLYLTGELARLRGKQVLAVKLFKKSLRDRKTFLPAYDALAGIYTAGKRRKDVAALAKRLASLKSDEPLALMVLGRCQLALGEPHKASQYLARAHDQRADHPPTLLLLAEAYAKLERLSEAAAVLSLVAAKAPDDVDIRVRLFRLHVRMLSPPTRIRLFRLYVSMLSPRVGKVTGRRGVRRPDDRRLRQAERFVRDTVRRHPDRIEGKLMEAELALIKGRRKQIDRAGELLARLRTTVPGNVDVRILTIRQEVAARGAKATAKQRDAWIERLGGILEAWPGKLAAVRLQADLLSESGREAAAADLWWKMYRRTSGDFEVAGLCVVALEAAKRLSKAADVLAQALRSNNEAENSGLRALLLKLLVDVKRYKEAADLGEKLLQEKLGDGLADGVRAMLLDVYEEGKMFDRAQKFLDDWILSTGEDADLAALRTQKIVMYARAKRLDQAEKYALAWIEQSPRALRPRHTLFSVLVEAEKYQRAGKHVNAWLKQAEAAAAQTSQPAGGKGRSLVRSCRQLLVRLTMAQQQYAEALKQTETFLKREPKNTTLLMLKSTCLTELGRDRQAIAPLEAALKVEPDNPTHNNNLGYLYADMGIHLAKAEQMVRKALKAHRDDRPRHIMDSLGWVLYKQGRVKEAARVFGMLLRRDLSAPSDKGVILDHAGDVYYRLGRPEKAVELWREALKKAREAKRPDAEVRKVLALADKKIRAVQAGAAAPVAAFGEGVHDKRRPTTKPRATQPAAPAANSRPAVPDAK